MNLRETLKKFGKDVGINIGAVRLYARQLLGDHTLPSTFFYHHLPLLYKHYPAIPSHHLSSNIIHTLFTILTCLLCHHYYDLLLNNNIFCCLLSVVLVVALRHLADLRVVHADIKLDNILCRYTTNTNTKTKRQTIFTQSHFDPTM